jgi:hypothetical protein
MCQVISVAMPNIPSDPTNESVNLFLGISGTVFSTFFYIIRT